jgi:hypothetical protein
VIALGCSRPPPAPSPQPAPIANTGQSCADAAAGLERSTRGLRPPESTVLDAMRVRCNADHWSAKALDCFATMQEGELGRCALALRDDQRDAMFAVLGGGEDARTKIAIARSRLEVLQVGVAECDRFVSKVATVLGCEQMPVEARAELGAETASFWDLPTTGLSPDAQRRMSEACGASLRELEHQASGAGCHQ